MDYKQGFEDAVTMFEDAINETISEGRNDLNKVITTLYTINLRWDDIYEGAKEESSELNKILKEMFDNA